MHPLIGSCEKRGEAHVWTCEWDRATVRYLCDHRVKNVSLLPGTCYIEMVAPAVEELFGDVPYELRNN